MVRILRPSSLLIAICLATLSPAGAEEELVGQVVCSNCWFEADRNRVAYGTAGDLDCAARCAEQGIPVALAVRHDDGFELFELRGEPGAAADAWLELVSRFARVSGQTFDLDEGKGLRVATVELLEENPWPQPEPADEVDVGSLEWVDLGGHTQSLRALHGRIVVLNFWATWCAPCKKEMPDLVRIQDEFGKFGVQVLGAAADAADGRDRVLTFARRQRLNFPLLLGATSAQMEGLGLGVALPATAIVDRAGNVVRRYRGVIDPHELERALHALIAGTAAHDAEDDGDEDHGHVHVAKRKSHASLVPS